jgi:hypothetical protein
MPLAERWLSLIIFHRVLQIMIAQVPLTHMRTIYTQVGDLFARLCTASLLILMATALRVIR